MKRAAVLLALILVGGGVTTFVVLHRHHPHPVLRRDDPHRAGLEYATAPLDALYRAPEGKTPCESAYNAYHAEQEVSAQHGVPSHFTKLADRATFLARCQTLPPAAQPCTIPRYNADHASECAKLKSAADVLKGLIELRPQDPLHGIDSPPHP